MEVLRWLANKGTQLKSGWGEMGPLWPKRPASMGIAKVDNSTESLTYPTLWRWGQGWGQPIAYSIQHVGVLFIEKLRISLI